MTILAFFRLLYLSQIIHTVYYPLNFLHRNRYSYNIQANLHMTDHCTPDFCLWRSICLLHIKYVPYVWDGRCIWRTNFPGPIESVICKFACITFLTMLHLSWYRFCIIANVLEAGVVSYSTRKLLKGEKLAKDVYTVSIFAPVSAYTVLNISTNI